MLCWKSSSCSCALPARMLEASSQTLATFQMYIPQVPKSNGSIEPKMCLHFCLHPTQCFSMKRSVCKIMFSMWTIAFAIHSIDTGIHCVHLSIISTYDSSRLPTLGILQSLGGNPQVVTTTTTRAQQQLTWAVAFPRPLDVSLYTVVTTPQPQPFWP